MTVTLPDGTQLTAYVGANSLWTTAIPVEITLIAGQVVYAVQSCPHALPSPSVPTIVQTVITRTVTGLVAPVVYDNLGLGDAFLDQFNITVELRTLLHVPSPLSAIVERNGTAVGRFTISGVPVGEYILYIHRPGYLPRTLAVSVTSASPETIELIPIERSAAFALWPGDVNGDGVVNSEDIDLLTSAMYSVYPTPPYAANMDFNADGYVNALDMSIATGQYNRSSADYPGAVWY